MAARLGDRVGKWVPVNEPNVVTLLGHGIGEHAPGQSLGFGALPVAHHLNLAHGLAVQALRDNGAREVGTATNHAPVWAASESPEDAGAAELFDALWNRIFADPMLLGRYPEGFGELMPVSDGDLARDQPAARLLRAQLLQPDEHLGARPRAPRSRSSRTSSTPPTRAPTSAGPSYPTGCGR